MKKTYPSIPGLEPDVWSNDACRGYVIMAMQDCGFSHEDISYSILTLTFFPENTIPNFKIS